MPVLPTNGPARRRILTPYVMIWVALASFALAYVALLGLRPHMLADADQVDSGMEEKLAQTRRDMERGLADLDPLRRSVGEVKMDVANLKIAVQEATDRDTMILEKVSALESRSPNAQPAPDDRAAAAANDDRAAAAAMVPPPPEPKPRKAGSARTSGPPVARVAAAAPGRNAQQALSKQKKSGGIETGSIKRTAPAPKVTVPAAPKPIAARKRKRQPVGLLVATGPSLDSLRLNWSILTDRHADTVRNLQPRYVVSGSAKNRTYGLVVGPVASTKEAKNRCKAMATQGLACEVSPYRGNSL